MRAVFATPILSLAILYLLSPAELLAQERRLQRMSAERRLALVVGNDAYSQSPLNNAVHDAQAMAKVLRGLDFDVDVVLDSDLRTLDRSVDAFIDRLRPDDVALFYYAGHGVQIEHRNYLVPVDFEASDEVEVKYQAYPADLIVDRMERSGSWLNIVVFDACRDNPFRSFRPISNGLARMETGKGTFIAFATAPGQTASDNPAGGNGLFTKFLVETLEVPGLSLDRLFNEVRRKVYDASSQSQLPWASSSVIGEFFFRPARTTARSDLCMSRETATGSLWITVNVAGAVIYLNQEKLAVTEEPETLHLEELLIGDHRLMIEKDGYEVAEYVVRVAAQEVSDIDVWLEPYGGVLGSDIESSDAFCDVLDMALSSCSQGFYDVAAASSSDYHSFHETAISFPGAWYNKVFRPERGMNEFLARFRHESAGGAQSILWEYVSKVESCLSPDLIVESETHWERHRLAVDLGHERCRIEIAVDGRNVGLEIYDYEL